MIKSKKYIILFIISIFILINTPIYATEKAIDRAVTLKERGLSPVLIIGLISTLPVFELRASIPTGIALFKLNPLLVYLIAVVFNLIPVLPILLFLNPIKKWLLKIGLFKGFFSFLDKKAEKNSHIVERYEELGLALFVSIPLPVTGAWTGSLIAVVMGLNVYKSFLYIAIGVTFAGIIVTLLTILGTIGLIIAIVLFTIFIGIYIARIVKNRKKSI